MQYIKKHKIVQEIKFHELSFNINLMNKAIKAIILIVTIVLIIGISHDEYGVIFSKVTIFWAVILAIYSSFIRKPKFHDDK
ncbi:hypothetical protein GCM10008106_28110 [Mongoliitalea lutea]|uniref:Uncharacterized protein n=1 Tax=Mongoliitalea lutea TaxID=849756 RepID=A0A8J3CYN8_9BACT|nr:hypothetical protein GCM10008106_28110 [Mongoliitalea lutea]